MSVHTELYERISVIQTKLANEALTPDLARQSLMRLTSLLGLVNDELRRADHEYKLVLLGCMAGGEPANRARIRAEVSEQYQRAREAKDTSVLVTELVRSCKGYLRSLDEELRLAK